MGLRAAPDIPAKAEVTSITAAHMANISGLMDVPAPSATSAITSRNRTPENSPARSPPLPHFLAETNAPTNAEIKSDASASGAEYLSGSGRESPIAAEIKRDTAPHAMPQSVPFTTHAKMLLFSADLRIIASETFLFYTYARLGQIMLICFRCFRTPCRLSFRLLRSFPPLLPFWDHKLRLLCGLWSGEQNARS